MPWIPGEHRPGICAVECVAAHLRGFEEYSRSEVVFWIDELSIEFRCYCFIVEEHVLLSALQHIFAGLRSGVVFWIEEWSIEFHRRGTCAVECVPAHLRGFEEDSRSEVVFWIEEWSIEFLFTVSSSRNMCCGVRCSTSSRVLAQLDLLWCLPVAKSAPLQQ